MVYDELNRLVERRTPGFVIPQWSDGIPTRLQTYGLPEPFVRPYPMYGNGSGYAIPADTARFTYDALGNILTANNRDAQITRTYYRNGLIKTETQRIRTLAELSAGGNFTSHVYTLTYTYFCSPTAPASRSTAMTRSAGASGCGPGACATGTPTATPCSNAARA